MSPKRFWFVWGSRLGSGESLGQAAAEIEDDIHGQGFADGRIEPADACELGLGEGVGAAVIHLFIHVIASIRQNICAAATGYDRIFEKNTKKIPPAVQS